MVAPSAAEVTPDWEHFDPVAYLDEYYGDMGTENLELLRFLAETYLSLPKGGVLLDFGGGPTIYPLISAATRVDEIHFCDYLEANLDEVRRWIDASPTAFDWDPFIRKALELETGEPCTDAEVEQRANRIKERITRLMHCDASRRPPIAGPHGLYDVVLTNFCAESATVFDSGVGVREEDRERIFGAFTQVDGSMDRRFGGTGLGLAISKQLVGLMGGQIDFASRPEGGSHFWFTMPVEVIDFDGAIDASLSMGGARILVVDDNATNRRILCHQLSGWECVVGMAANGPQALEELSRAARGDRPYQLALLDMMMPGMTGLELAARIRRDPGIGPIRLIFLTSVGVALNPREQAELAIDAQLTKPARRRELRRVMAGAIGIPIDSEISARGVEAAEARPRALDWKPRVLLAEDTPVNQEVAMAMLEGIGCRVTLVANGQLAVEAVERERFDLVLMDCQMPVLDGFGATMRIRAREQQRSADSHEPAVPIVAVTAHAMEGDRERCLEAGMDDHLSKPFSRSSLVGMVERWVRRPSVEPVRERSDQPAGGARGEGAGEGDATTAPLDPAALDELAALPGAEKSGLVARVISLYLTTSYPLGSVLRDAAERGDADELASSAHRLKSTSAEVGAKRLAELSRKLEVQSRKRAIATAPGLVAEIERELERVRRALESRRGVR